MSLFYIDILVFLPEHVTTLTRISCVYSTYSGRGRAVFILINQRPGLLVFQCGFSRQVWAQEPGLTFTTQEVLLLILVTGNSRTCLASSQTIGTYRKAAQFQPVMS